MIGGLPRYALKLVVLLLVVLAAASCGRRGGLEAPVNSATVIDVDENGNELPPVEESSTEDKPFILDPLL